MDPGPAFFAIAAKHRVATFRHFEPVRADAVEPVIAEHEAGPQNGGGVGTGTDPDMLSDQAQRLDTAGQKVQVPTRLANGPGVRPTDGTEDQSTPDPSEGGHNVAELAQAQQTGQMAPEQNLVPGEQRPVVRGYFR